MNFKPQKQSKKRCEHIQLWLKTRVADPAGNEPYPTLEKTRGEDPAGNEPYPTLEKTRFAYPAGKEPYLTLEKTRVADPAKNQGWSKIPQEKLDFRGILN